MILKSQKKEEVIPTLGETKYITKYAFFPTKLSNGEIIWLEKYNVKYVYKRVCKELVYKEFDHKMSPGPVLASQGAITYPAGFYKNEWCEESKKALYKIPFFKQLNA